jgi:hypothetical protein
LDVYSELISIAHSEEAGCDFGIGSNGKFALAKVTVVPTSTGVICSLADLVSYVNVIDPDLEMI